MKPPSKADGRGVSRPWSTGDRLRRAVVTFGGTGLSPIAPGTVGSLATVGVIWGGRELLAPSVPGWWVSAAVGLLAAAANVVLGGWIARHFGQEDPGAVVLDEVAGQSIALSVVGASVPAWANYLAGFLLFRCFDIAKPLGIRRLEALPAGWGILMDDVLAGVYAAGVWAIVVHSL